MAIVSPSILSADFGKLGADCRMVLDLSLIHICHLKGMEADVAAGIIAGSAEKELEVISEVSEDKKTAIRDYLQTVPISIQHIEQGHVFDIIVTERSGDSYAKVRLSLIHI